MDVKEAEGGVANSYFPKAMKCKETAAHPWMQGGELTEKTVSIA